MVTRLSPESRRAADWTSFSPAAISQFGDIQLAIQTGRGHNPQPLGGQPAEANQGEKYMKRILLLRIAVLASPLPSPAREGAGDDASKSVRGTGN